MFLFLPDFEHKLVRVSTYTLPDNNYVARGREFGGRMDVWPSNLKHYWIWTFLQPACQLHTPPEYDKTALGGLPI